MMATEMDYCISFVKYKGDFYGPKCSDFQTLLFNGNKIKFCKVLGTCSGSQ